VAGPNLPRLPTRQAPSSTRQLTVSDGCFQPYYALEF
jgi:hypothetical protein